MRPWLKSFLSEEATEEGRAEGPERGCSPRLRGLGRGNNMNYVHEVGQRAAPKKSDFREARTALREQALGASGE